MQDAVSRCAALYRATQPDSPTNIDRASFFFTQAAPEAGVHYLVKAALLDKHREARLILGWASVKSLYFIQTSDMAALFEKEKEQSFDTTLNLIMGRDAHLLQVFEHENAPTRIQMAKIWFALAEHKALLDALHGTYPKHEPPSTSVHGPFDAGRRPRHVPARRLPFVYLVTCAACQSPPDAWACLCLAATLAGIDAKFRITWNTTESAFWWDRFNTVDGARLELSAEDAAALATLQDPSPRQRRADATYQRAAACFQENKKHMGVYLLVRTALSDNNTRAQRILGIACQQKLFRKAVDNMDQADRDLIQNIGGAGDAAISLKAVAKFWLEQDESSSDLLADVPLGTRSWVADAKLRDDGRQHYRNIEGFADNEKIVLIMMLSLYAYKTNHDAWACMQLGAMLAQDDTIMGEKDLDEARHLHARYAQEHDQEESRSTWTAKDRQKLKQLERELSSQSSSTAKRQKT